MQQQTSQWLLQQVPMGEVPPKKDSEEQVALAILSLVPRQGLEGIAQHMMQGPWTSRDSSQQ